MGDIRHKVKWMVGGAVIASVFILFISHFGISNINSIVVKNDGIVKCIDIGISALSMWSIYFLYRQIKSEHEKGRREKAAELLLSWTLNVKPEANSAMKIVECFNKEQCVSLNKEETFSVDCILYSEIETIIPSKRKPDIEEKDMKARCETCNGDRKSQCVHDIELTVKQVKKLRYLIISYLNLLESVLVAWKNGIADKDIIEEQFAFLLKPKENKNCLEDFRIACGSEVAYPAIETFCWTLEEKRRNKLIKKDIIE